MTRVQEGVPGSMGSFVYKTVQSFGGEAKARMFIDRLMLDTLPEIGKLFCWRSGLGASIRTYW